MVYLQCLRWQERCWRAVWTDGSNTHGVYSNTFCKVMETCFYIKMEEELNILWKGDLLQCLKIAVLLDLLRLIIIHLHVVFTALYRWCAVLKCLKIRYMGTNIGCICCKVIYTVTQSNDSVVNIQCCKQIKLRINSMFQMGKPKKH